MLSFGLLMSAHLEPGNRFGVGDAYHGLDRPDAQESGDEKGFQDLHFVRVEERRHLEIVICLKIKVQPRSFHQPQRPPFSARLAEAATQELRRCLSFGQI
ncbi:hypothetical protein PT974_04647 [Cladobotryum mycophilum]|uniref:Uncharacterized protein n=1 Tax=Cladobotryum mycophilum TaxID=491253 RepID=A0ABR0SVT0_9HYPO